MQSTHSSGLCPSWSCVCRCGASIPQRPTEVLSRLWTASASKPQKKTRKRSFINRATFFLFLRICMKNISQTMDKAESSKNLAKNESDISIVERIVRKTGNRKLAAILALDLFLVGVDTVSQNNISQILKKLKILLPTIVFAHTYTHNRPLWLPPRQSISWRKIQKNKQNFLPNYNVSFPHVMLK